MKRGARPLEPTAALSAIAVGVQGRGPWIGRRQLVARFAGEAETATLFTAAAFGAEIDRIATRSPFHSLAIGGRDPLGHAAFLVAAFGGRAMSLPTMLETDGQRPDAIPGLRQVLRLVQVSPAALNGAAIERAIESLAVAADVGCEHALVLDATVPGSDGQLLRVVEQAHRASAGTMIVVHPGPGDAASVRRWSDFLAQASTLHDDVRVLPAL